ncbi:MAG: NADH-quinone oxidoreductase subunit N [Ferruginibacter sp.]
MSDYFFILKSELLVTGLIFLLLLLKLSGKLRNDGFLLLTQMLLLVNFIAGFFFNKEGVLFDGLYNSTALIVFQKNVLNLGVYLISLLFAGWFRKNEHMPEYFMLMLSALLGMFFMISSGHLLMFYLSLELATIPVAAMANFDLDKRVSSEAAMKMILSSAFSSGILLFGISLIYGATGTLSFVQLAGRVIDDPLHILAVVFLLSAFAFKLSVVPFHLWTADVYQGAPVPTTSFLSVISKGSVAFIFMTVLFRVLSGMTDTWYNMLMVLSVATMIVGNLFALRQDNIKRFLAFSSIAQVGFILVGISSSDISGTHAVIYFVLIYIFSNLAAFGVAGAIAAATGREHIDDYKGLYKSNPFLSWMMALALFSLAGVPPTAGFFGKLFLLTAGGLRASYVFITIAALNLIISLYYYLRVVRAMFMETTEQPLERIKPEPSVQLGLWICAAGIVLTGLLSWIYDHIQTLF